jgi:hypothetical protein
MTTPTPRTDALIVDPDADATNDDFENMTDHARQLERDLAAAQERIERLEACVNGEVPEGALNALGRWLAPVLNEDQWPTAERFLNAALLQLLEAQEALKAAEERAEQNARDAERYRWLRGNPCLPYGVVKYRSEPTEYYAGDSLDAAIDAAIAAGEGK